MRVALIALIASALLVTVACGTSGATTPAPSGPSASASVSAEPSGVALTGGDIPDNQAFATYPRAGLANGGFVIEYPDGWVQQARADGVTFQDKDNQIVVTIRAGSQPTVDSVRQEVAAIPGASVTTAAHTASLASGTAIAVTYQVDGAANAVTGKRPRLTVDRYYLARTGKVAVLELATPVGVDNVDAYRRVAGSFSWR